MNNTSYCFDGQLLTVFRSHKKLYGPATFLCVQAFGLLWVQIVGLPPAASARSVPVLALHARLICSAIPPYIDAKCERGCVPPANRGTICCSQARYTRELHPYCTWRVPLHRRLDKRPSICALPNRRR